VIGRLNHVAIVVPDLDAARAAIQRLGMLETSTLKSGEDLFARNYDTWIGMRKKVVWYSN